MADEIDARLRVFTDFKQAVDDAKRLDKEFADIIKSLKDISSSEFSKPFAEAARQAGNLKKSIDAIKQLNLLPQGSLADASARAGTRAAKNIREATPEFQNLRARTDALAVENALLRIAKQQTKELENQVKLSEQARKLGQLNIQLDQARIRYGAAILGNDSKSIALARQELDL